MGVTGKDQIGRPGWNPLCYFWLMYESDAWVARRPKLFYGTRKARMSDRQSNHVNDSSRAGDRNCVIEQCANANGLKLPDQIAHHRRSRDIVVVAQYRNVCGLKSAIFLAQLERADSRANLGERRFALEKI